MIEQLQRLDIAILNRFLETRNAEACGIPEKLAEYILQMNFAANLHKKHPGITECAKKLQQEYPALSLQTCRQRIYDAINYLNTDCTVTTEAWNLYFADQLMELREVNLVAHDFKEARICMEKAREYRIEASAHAIDPDRVRFKPQIVSPDIQLERMGIKPKGLLEAYTRAKQIVAKKDIPDSEKQRILDETRRELNITDVEHENIPN